MKKTVFAAIAAIAMVSVSNIFANNEKMSFEQNVPVDTTSTDTTVTEQTAPAENVATPANEQTAPAENVATPANADTTATATAADSTATTANQ